MKDYNYSGRPLLEKDPKFFSSKEVNTSMSGHHIPTNVYEFSECALYLLAVKPDGDLTYFYADFPCFME